MVRFNEYLWGDDFSLVIMEELSEWDFEYQLWYEHGIDLRCREVRDLELWLDMTGNLDADVSFGRLDLQEIFGWLLGKQQPFEEEFQEWVLTSDRAIR